MRGEKRDNVGYARIENYGKESKITIHLKDMNKQEKEDFIIRRTYELNRLFVNYKVSKDKQKAMNEQMNEVKKIHRELIVNYIAEMEDVINPMSNAVTPAIAAALTLVLKAIESDMTAADIAFKDVLCIWNREVVNCEEDAKS